mmetsp:Transcript_15900/g.23964  ORF Transcript_15900/g.23964 Transcript_15900/m.23964 type:complete len:475 (+) Transcript_15900:84-1508(+)
MSRLRSFLRMRMPPGYARAAFRVKSALARVQLPVGRLGRRLKTTIVSETPIEESISKNAKPAYANGQMAWWLYGCAGMVFGMVALGGITRLTGSGLSMVEWKPAGILPPLSEAGWKREFEKYKKFPEYQKHNDELSLREFKWIWYMEWGHRMAGRATGLVFALPLAYFGARKFINGPLAMRLSGLLVLGGSQGVIGWWMVKSGLDDSKRFGGEGRVSPYRLATHLSMAFLLYTCLFNTALGLHTASRLSRMTPAMRAKLIAASEKIPKSLRRASIAVSSLVGLTAFSGAFVAGNHAGLIYDEFPKMGGQWVPDDIVDPYLKPVWRNIFEHDTMVQWNHRVLAMSTLGSVCGLYAYASRFPIPAQARLAGNLMLGMSAVQVSLGISTLLLHVPVPLASAHQMGSLTLLTLSLWFVHTLLPLRVATSAAGLLASAVTKRAIAGAATSATATAGGFFLIKNVNETFDSKCVDERDGQ